MAYELDGKAALVTGAMRGIGFETAKLLHARGACVTLLDVDEAGVRAAVEAIGGDRVLGQTADVRDEAALEAAVAATVARFGRLDVAVANAGIAPNPATVRAMPPAEFDRVLDVNLHGVVHTVRAALPQIAEREGHFVLIASVYAFVNGVLQAPYAVAKAGVEQLGRALRAELAQHGASASVAYFGFIDTKMVADAFAHPEIERLRRSIPLPLRKMLPPEAAAKAIVNGIEGRKPRIIAPRRWAALSVGRGLAGPAMDRIVLREPQMRRALREADRSPAGE